MLTPHNVKASDPFHDKKVSFTVRALHLRSATRG